MPRSPASSEFPARTPASTDMTHRRPDLSPLPDHLVRAAVARSLEEDLGLSGDITSQACLPSEARGRSGVRLFVPFALINSAASPRPPLFPPGQRLTWCG